jgi:hypothetical protein
VSVLDAGTDGDSYKDVSRELATLTKWAASRQVTVLALTHLRKSTDGQALNQMMGSRAFTSKPRSVLMTFPHPSDPETRLLTHTKCNVGAQGLTWGYRIEGVTIDAEARSTVVRQGTEVVDTSRVRYLEALEMFSADQLMAGAGKPPKETAAQRAEKIVRDELDSHGGAMIQADLLRAIASQGLSEQAFRTGRALAGVTGSMVIGRKSTYAWHYEGMNPAQVAEATDPRLAAAQEPAAADTEMTRNQHLFVPAVVLRLAVPLVSPLCTPFLTLLFVWSVIA